MIPISLCSTYAAGAAPFSALPAWVNTLDLHKRISPRLGHLACSVTRWPFFLVRR